MQMSFNDIENLWINKCWKEGETFNLYIDNPYCVQQCKFCVHFGAKTAIGSPAYKDYYEGVLPGQIFKHLNILKSHKIDSVYFGGGSPSIMTKETMVTIFNLIPEFAKIKYKHFEAHPLFITKDKVDILKDYGFKYVSLGIQTFNPQINKINNRTPINIDKLKDIVNYIQSNGMYVNCDLLAYIYDNNGYANISVFKEDLDILMNDVGSKMITTYPMYQAFSVNFEASNINDLSENIVNHDLQKIIDIRKAIMKATRKNNNYSVYGWQNDYILNREKILNNFFSDIYITSLSEEEVGKIKNYNCSSYPFQPEHQNTLGIGGSDRDLYSYMGKKFYYLTKRINNEIVYKVIENKLGD